VTRADRLQFSFHEGEERAQLKSIRATVAELLCYQYHIMETRENLSDDAQYSGIIHLQT
jgi:hypothetical protein